MGRPSSAIHNRELEKQRKLEVSAATQREKQIRTTITQNLLKEAQEQRAIQARKVANLEHIGRQFLNKEVKAPTVGPIRGAQAQAQRAEAARLGDIEGLPQLQQAVGREYQQAGNVNIDDYLRVLQQGGQATPQALEMARSAALGNAPSAAQAQLQAGVDQAIAAQFAAGASAGGGAAALRGAQQQSGMMQQQAANEAAMLRAQEMAQARALYGQLAGQSDQMIAQGAGLSLGAQELAGQQRMNALAAMQQSANLGLQAATTQANLNQAANLANLDIAARTELANQAASQEAALLQAQLGMQGQLAQMEQERAYRALGAGLTGQGLETTSSRLGLEIESMLGMQGLGLSRRAQDLASSQANRAFLATLLGGVMSAGGAIAASGSDKRIKKDIEPNDSTTEFLAALTDNKYKYKDTSMRGTKEGVQYGPMAQDLVKTEMGKTAVVDMGGYMGVDPSRAVLLALSGLSNLHNRLEKLEAK